MHKRIVFSVVARIVLVVSILMFFPLAWAFYDSPGSSEVAAFSKTIFLGVVLSMLFLLKYRIQKEDFKRFNPKDGLAVVGLSWIVLSALGALPLFLSSVTATYTDAFFEIVSGFTTTGATIFSDIEALPRGILFWRSLTHWLGGMGIIVLFIALLPALGQKSAQLYKAEAPGLAVERVEPRLKETAKNLWTVYFILSVAEVVVLMFLGMPVFDSLCHTFGTMATGGFSTKNASIGFYGPAIQWTITVFMFLAGINFALHYQAMRGRVSSYFKSEEFRYYFYIIIFSVPLFAAILSAYHVSGHAFRDAAFQIVAILTTTGYVTANFDLWPNALRFALVMFMFIGGCGGSTGGGMKFIRFLLSVKSALRSIMQAIYPNIVSPIKFNGVPMQDKMITAVLSYFVIYILLFFLGTVFLTVTEGCDLLTALTASISALSNIGPGLAQVGPTQDFAWFSSAGKWVLIFLMLAGRLELYSILILFVPATWKK